MNAYELADELDKFNKDGMPVLIISQAIDMLRKQAERIVQLEQEMQEQKKIFDDEVQSYINDVNMFQRRITYFASKRGLWMKKYNEKCQEISKLKGVK
jgi:hypothetical protein